MNKAANAQSVAPAGRAKLLAQYGCGPIQFTSSDNALYERHLLFDSAVDPAASGARERYEAFARSVRDILSQRWVRTEKTYQTKDLKRVYYLSMEFLIGRSLSNNVVNLLLDPIVKQATKDKNLDLAEVIEQEPDAGLGNGGLGRLAACFLDSMATLELPAMGMGCGMNMGFSNSRFRTACSAEKQTSGFATRTSGKSLAFTKTWK